MQRALDVGGVGADQHGAARRQAAGLGQRRGVEPQRPAAELQILEAGVPGERARHGAVAGQDARAERERARHDPAAPVEHLDHDLPPAARRLERARRGQHGGGRDAEAGDVARALLERLVERGAQLLRRDRARGDAEQRQRGEDRAERGGHEPGAERARSHERSMNPTPRTVWMSGGSPSFWRSRPT